MDEIEWEAVEHSIAVGRPLRFSGSDAEIARAFLLAWVLLREKIEAGGVVGIDYEKLAQPSAPTPGRGFGGWLDGSFAIIDEFEQIALDTVRFVEPQRVEAWVKIRRPDKRVSSKKIAAAQGRSERAVRLDAEFLDRCLVGVLRQRDYVVRGG